MMKRDLNAAEIEYKDEDGRVLDFHSLRATTATLLARANVPLTIAQRILRHSDPKLTANVYSKLELFDLSAGIQSLPGIPFKRPPHENQGIQAMKATGTEGKTDTRRISQHVGQHVGVSDSLRSSVSIPEQKNTVNSVTVGSDEEEEEESGMRLSESQRAQVSPTEQRTGRDSNPRSDFSDAGFQDQCIRPLCHPSGLNCLLGNRPSAHLWHARWGHRGVRPHSQGSRPKPVRQVHPTGNF